MIENAENLDRVMPVNNLLEYSDNYPMISETVWNYRDEIDDVDGTLFKYKTKIIRKTPEQPPRTGNSWDADQSAKQKMSP